ncbi:lef-3 [Alphabaculovirus alterspexiguae]|uniref:Lef-3 n=1 Tax=Spodoptera exigua multiple nucleopolyhedrovirus TaxID=10454 RepID=A0A3G2JU20_9ABAC|nr:lef-3 [Spodoptera exigua multiple nucleopolyhedrovirus]AYN45040.1 lef-3 [Spodoptera exigua multiple nucleopolyhedrovirus]
MSLKRVNENMLNDNDLFFNKRTKHSPQKRVSMESNASNASSSSKKIGKTVTGQLVTKNMYCINNEAYYLFKFLVDNVSKNYYGNAGHFQSLRDDATYELELVYENKRLAIAKATECKNVENMILIKKHLEQSDFDGEDTVSVTVKFKYGFKVIDSDAYKCVFVVNFGDAYENCRAVQIECMTSLAKWANCIRDEDIISESNLLEFFDSSQNQTFNLCRVKCQLSNGNYKNFSIQDITYVTRVDTPACDIAEDEDAIANISRLNKRILFGEIKKCNVTHPSPERFTVTYTLKDPEFKEEIIRASFFVKINDKKNDKFEKLEKLETDLNQLQDLIESDIIKVYIYVSVDLSTKNYNVLGMTKIEIDTDIYEGL